MTMCMTCPLLWLQYPVRLLTLAYFYWSTIVSRSRILLSTSAHSHTNIIPNTRGGSTYDKRVIGNILRSKWAVALLKCIYRPIHSLSYSHIIPNSIFHIGTSSRQRKCYEWYNGSKCNTKRYNGLDRDMLCPVVRLFRLMCKSGNNPSVLLLFLCVEISFVLG